MPRKQGLGRKHKKGTGIYKGQKHGRARVSVAHPQPYSLTPLNPNDKNVVAPAAVATTDREFATITPSPHPAAPTQSPPKFNNKKIEFSSIKAAPIDDGKAFRLNKKGEARTDVSRRQAKSRSSQMIVRAIVSRWILCGVMGKLAIYITGGHGTYQI
jgi:hypothetical protein